MLDCANFLAIFRIILSNKKEYYTDQILGKTGINGLIPLIWSKQWVMPKFMFPNLSRGGGGGGES